MQFRTGTGTADGRWSVDGEIQTCVFGAVENEHLGTYFYDQKFSGLRVSGAMVFAYLFAISLGNCCLA